jgi:hypothetical protein
VIERMAPQVGLEPTTLRLTAGCSAIELLRSECGAHPAADNCDQRAPKHLDCNGCWAGRQKLCSKRVSRTCHRGKLLNRSDSARADNGSAAQILRESRPCALSIRPYGRARPSSTPPPGHAFCHELMSDPNSSFPTNDVIRSSSSNPSCWADAFPGTWEQFHPLLTPAARVVRDHLRQYRHHTISADVDHFSL